jgi:glucose/arabinose dehydrogenase
MLGRRFLHLFVIASLLVLVTACGGGGGTLTTNPPPPSGTPTIALTPFVSGLSTPVDFQTPDDGSGRIFIVQQSGTIRIVSGGSLLPTPFLDISSRINFDGGEQGLLGLAFHPSYSQNKRFYLNYDRLSGSQIQTVIAEYQLTADPNAADPASERILLTVNQPFSNHKAGQMAFGPDGFLYIAFGDGGSGGDPMGNGQNRGTLLGKVARIGVDPPFTSGLQYVIPADNPFVGTTDRGEIWAYGFRNPWRFSFEKGGTRLFVADVGQDKFEEIDLVQKGLNYGWNTMEGSHCFTPATGCNMTGLTLPIVDYDHSEGVTVIGGYVYHGTAISSLAGAYIFGDFSNGKIWELTESSGTWTRTQLLNSGKNMSAFGQDAAGELYVVDYSGSVFKITAQ